MLKLTLTPNLILPNRRAGARRYVPGHPGGRAHGADQPRAVPVLPGHAAEGAAGLPSEGMCAVVKTQSAIFCSSVADLAADAPVSALQDTCKISSSSSIRQCL